MKHFKVEYKFDSWSETDSLIFAADTVAEASWILPDYLLYDSNLVYEGVARTGYFEDKDVQDVIYLKDTNTDKIHEVNIMSIKEV